MTVFLEDDRFSISSAQSLPPRAVGDIGRSAYLSGSAKRGKRRTGGQLPRRQHASGIDSENVEHDGRTGHDTARRGDVREHSASRHGVRED